MLAKLKETKSQSYAIEASFSSFKKNSENTLGNYSKKSNSWTYSRKEGKRLPSHKIMKELYESIYTKDKC